MMMMTGLLAGYLVGHLGSKGIELSCCDDIHVHFFFGVLAWVWYFEIWNDWKFSLGRYRGSWLYFLVIDWGVVFY